MENLWNIKELCQVLNVTESTARAWVFQEKIPVLKVGGLLRFRPSEIERWLSQGERKPAALEGVK